MDDVLLILPRGRSVTDVEALTAISQRYGDRVLVVPGAASTAVAELGIVVMSGAAAPEGDASLTETEALGIAAWNLRAGMADKPRKGDGLAWDAEGFDAP